jgi:hypothetical protein
MKKFNLFFLRPIRKMLLAIMLLHCGLFYAQDYSMTQIQSMAETYFEMGSNAVKGRSTTSVTWDTLYLGNKPKMFLCQDGNDWVVFANEQSVEPIVCYGEGRLSLTELQESPLWFLLTESMIGLDSLRITGKSMPQKRTATAMSTRSTTKPTPLLGNNYWGQSRNNSGGNYDVTRIYNKYCPTFFDCSDGRTYVGCTAVAMGQVMWYNQWPPVANIPSNINKAGITSGDKIARYYDWNNMPNYILDSTPLDQANAVASLLRDCGYAGHMIYSKTGSAMTLTNAIAALRNTFKYEAHMKQYSSGANIFNNIIKSEIAARRPVIIQATHKSDGSAHTFVIDGYDSADETYHINLGWRGSSNAWYSVSGADCYANYTVARRMLYEIIPDYDYFGTQSIAAEEEITEQVTKQPVLSIKKEDDLINIVVENEENVKWSIYDIYGKKVTSGNSLQVNTSTLPVGTYTIIIESTTDAYQTKFIK